MQQLPGATLDPPDWDAFRAQAHAMLDDILDYTRDIRERPVWQPTPDAVRQAFDRPLPRQPCDIASVHATFRRDILPYAAANTHPGFMGWVQGGGTAVGTVAEMLAAGLNANLGGRDQVPVRVEWQVLKWVRELFGFPDDASGLFVTGTSAANQLAVLIARTGALGTGVREQGLAAFDQRLTAYASADAHHCIAQALDLAGIGKAALRLLPIDADHRMDVAALAQRIGEDRAAGLLPFFIAGTAGTVDTGAIDDLDAIASLAQRESIWFHVDGAFGALGMLAPTIAPLLRGIERADSIAFDFHKWGQVPYDAGFLLVRDCRLHQQTFASSAAYLSRNSRGMAAGSPWPCDFGPDLSRGFRALKTWFTFQVHGADAIGRSIARSCELASRLKNRIADEPQLELLAPVALNVVCFRYRCQPSDSVNADAMNADSVKANAVKADAVNADIVIGLQEAGRCAPSSTRVRGRLAIRAAIVNHRTAEVDIDLLIDETLALGARLSAGHDALAPP